MRAAARTAVALSTAVHQDATDKSPEPNQSAKSNPAGTTESASVDRDDVPTLGRWLAFFSLVIVGVSIDLATKSWIFGRLGLPSGDKSLSVIGDILILETSLNEGALFGFGQGGSWIFAVLAFVAVTGILGWLSYGRAIQERGVALALGSIVGGILGNLYDRLGFPGLKWNYPAERIGEPVHAVRDWIHFQIPPIGFDFAVFNIADSLLVVGVSFLLWQTFRAEARRDQAPTEA